MDAFIRWDTRQACLIDREGYPVTDAQARKAKAYLKEHRIHLAGTDTEPGVVRATYWIGALAGCRKPNVVQVSIFDRPDGSKQTVYSCKCQRARGTIKDEAALCSHVLAVRAFRKVDA